MKNKVLLCDDETHILRAAEIKLTRCGYEVECANDGEEAWEAILRRMPDILVTDLQMPRLDGVALCRRVREHAETRHLPILMLTAKGFEQSHRDLMQQFDVLAIMPKPFSPRDLAQTVDRVLNGTYAGNACTTGAGGAPELN